MFKAILCFLVAACSLLSLFPKPLAAEPLGEKKPLIGLALNVPSGGGAKELIAAVQTEQADHVGLVVISAKWSDLEPHPGVYNLKTIEDAVRGLPPLGFRLAVTLQTLDTNNRALPADLQAKPFSSPEIHRRFDALLDRIAPLLSAAVCDVNLGNESDVYLAAHPQELEAFAGFVEAGRTYLHALKPGLAVGVTTTFDGLRDHPQIFRRLNENMDVVALTYYPLTSRYQVRPVSEISGDFDAMAAASGAKPLMLTEAGYPADTILGSSEAQQAAFVDAVFDATQKHAPKIVFVCFFLIYDMGPALVNDLLRYYRLPDVRFRAFLSTLGLRQADGTPRLAWQRFEIRMAERSVRH